MKKTDVSDNFEISRNKMVDEQIYMRGITDASILDVMRRIPRHKFIGKQHIQRAYDDCPVPIGEGQTISQPYMVALMTQYAESNPNKRVLEIGLGSGYQTAVLAELNKEVYSVERIPVLWGHATQLLKELNYNNVQTFLGDGASELFMESQLFDAILVTAAAPSRPDYLFSYLAPGGRLIVPIGDRNSQVLTLITVAGHTIVEEIVCKCSFVPLVGQYAWSL